MSLPNLPATTAQQDLADQAKELRKALEDAGKSMKDVTEDNLAAMVKQLAKVIDAANNAAPALAGLYKLDPSGARALREQFQSVIDKAVEMASVAHDKAEEAAKAADLAAKKHAKDKAAESKEQAHGVAAKIAGAAKVATGNVSGADVGGAIGSLAGPEGQIVGEAAGAAFDEITGAIKQAISALGDYITTSVQAANPGVWERNQRALQDLSAVFGQAFTPIVELATEAADKLNGVLSEIAPIVGEMVQTIVSDLKPVMDAVFSLMETLADVFKGV